MDVCLICIEIFGKMIQKISEKLADFVIKEGFIDEKNRDVLVYGNILLISERTSL